MYNLKYMSYFSKNLKEKSEIAFLQICQKNGRKFSFNMQKVLFFRYAECF